MKLVENAYQFCVDHGFDNKFYRGMVAHEYAQNAMRIRKSTSYRNFVKCMNNVSFRKGIGFANSNSCSKFERIIFSMLNHRIYLPFIRF